VSLKDWNSNQKFFKTLIMLKNILNLAGAEQLSKKEQKTIKGGITRQCADAWSSMSCATSTLANCNLNGGMFFCGKCCF